MKLITVLFVVSSFFAKGQIQFYINDSLVEIGKDYTIILHEKDDTIPTFTYNGEYPTEIDGFSKNRNAMMVFIWQEYNLSFCLERVPDYESNSDLIKIRYYTKKFEWFNEMSITRLPVAFLVWDPCAICMFYPKNAVLIE